MLVFMIDLVLARSAMGKLDTASYSLVNVLKERSRFYAKSPTISDEDVTKLQKMAAKLLFNDPESKEVRISVEQLRHESDGSVNVSRKGDINSCQAATALRAELSPYSQALEAVDRKQLFVYQVTLCMNITSPFRYFLLHKDNRVEHGIRSSSVGVGR